jgi:hypothetical protein
MSEIDRLARKLRAAYAAHHGAADTLTRWSRLDLAKKDGWRAIAKTALAELGQRK